MDLEAMTMSSVAPSDQAVDLLQKLSLNPQSKESGESSMKHSTESGDDTNCYVQSIDSPITSSQHDTIDPMGDSSMGYFPSYWYPVYYYEGGFEDIDNEWNEYSRFSTTEDLLITPGVHDSAPLIYYPAYGYVPYDQYMTAGSPMSILGYDTQLDGTTYQQYLYIPTHVQQQADEQLHPPTTTTTTSLVVSPPGAGDITTSTGVSAAGEEVPTSSVDTASAPVMGDSNGAVVAKSTSQISGGCFGRYHGNITDVFYHLTVGPRAKNSSSENQNSSFTPIVDYNRPDFRVNYENAKFFIIKSYSEDDVHGSIKYNVWSSTENGNRKLDAAYLEAQKNPVGCPVFLFFSVNGSGQFVGVAEMVGRVDFNKSMDFWQLDRWRGYFPVKWHIVKDVPNFSLKHIIIKSNENKPVTSSRDTQEVMLEEGLQLLKIFKEHQSNQCILDDFDLYEYRQMLIKENRSRQEQLRKQKQKHYSRQEQLQKQEQKQTCQKYQPVRQCKSAKGESSTKV